MELRRYQEEAIEAMKNYKGRGGLVILPTGAGKSVVVQKISKNYFEALIVAPRKILVEQYKNKYNLPSICYNSLKKEDMNKYDLILFDEAHFCSRGIRWFKDFLEEYKGQYFGLTATPYRENDDMILKDKFFNEIIYHKEVFELTSQEYLSPINFVPMEQFNDYLREFSVINSSEIGKEGDILCDFLIEIYNREKENGVVLVFLPMIDVCNEVGRRLIERGYSTKIINSKVKCDVSDISIYNFCLNVDMLTTGFDLPSLSTIVIARNTESINKYFQIIGRGTRTFEGKKQCNVYDCSYKYKGIEDFSVSLYMKDCVALINKKLGTCVNKKCKNTFRTEQEIYCPKCGAIGRYANTLLNGGATFTLDKKALIVPPYSMSLFEEDIEKEYCHNHGRKYTWYGRYTKRCPDCWILGNEEDKKEDRNIKIIDLEYLDTTEHNEHFRISIKRASFADRLLQVTFYNKNVIATTYLPSPDSSISQKTEVNRMLHKIILESGNTFNDLFLKTRDTKMSLQGGNYYVLVKNVENRDYKKLLKVYKKTIENKKTMALDK